MASIVNELFLTVITSKLPNFKSYSWGDKEELIKENEGKPDYTGVLSGLDAYFVGYNTQASGLNVILTYYFCKSGLYGTRYILNEKHSVETKYIEDYNTFKNAIINKYGDPDYDDESWDTERNKEYYLGNKGDALSYGYLTFSTTWYLDDTIIYMDLSADNYEILLTINYQSVLISPGSPDYSDDF